MEASARMGWVETDFSSDELCDFMGNGTEYDSGSMYYGAHAGLGYIWAITEQADLDFYGKYIWTHEDGESITTNIGDSVTFDDADSHRLRGGVRLSYAIATEKVVIAPYIGGAYEHEFDGEARATTYGRDIDVLNLEGGTGIGEIGLNFKPVADSGFGIDLACKVTPACVKA